MTKTAASSSNFISFLGFIGFLLSRVGVVLWNKICSFAPAG